MSSQATKRPLKKTEDSSPTNFAAAKLGLREMMDIFDYLDGRRTEPHVPMKAEPPCKFGRYGDLFAKTTTQNATSQNRPQLAKNECLQKPSKNGV